MCAGLRWGLQPGASVSDSEAAWQVFLHKVEGFIFGERRVLRSRLPYIYV